MSLAGEFRFFDPQQPFAVTLGELPHWEQDGASYFITFRTADSIGAAVGQQISRERDEWLRRHGIDPLREDWRAALQRQPYEFQLKFHREYSAKLESALDKGYGACVLKAPALAQIVSNSLLYFDGYQVADVAPQLGNSHSMLTQPPGSYELRSCGATSATSGEVRYHISDFVVMPNHVHVLVCFLRGIRLFNQCRAWKHFMAMKINAALGTKGEFWQPESFDHLVRDAAHFERFRKYIADNPSKANLPPGQYLHYRRPE